MLQTTKPKLVFCDDNNYEVVRSALERVVANGDQMPPLYVLESDRKDVKHAEDLLKETGQEERFLAPYLGDSRKTLAAILCSSGSSGVHKGVRITHAACAHKTRTFCFSSVPAVDFNFSSLYWTTGFTLLLSTFFTGHIRLFTRNAFNENDLFTAIEEHRASVIFTPPSSASAMLAHPRTKTADFSSVVYWITGGSSVPERLRDRMDALLAPTGGRFVNAIGPTETGMIAIDLVKRKPNAIGPLMPNIMVRIVDEDGNRMGVGEPGELLVKAVEAFGGYYENEEATANALDADGFFRTGDVAYIDEEGYLYVVDRQKDIFKYRNYQISPTDLEAIISRIEGVRDVCVVGIPDEESATDVPAAAIVRLPNASGLEASQVRTVVDGQVSDFKRLRGGVYFVEELPKTHSGKILRRKSVGKCRVSECRTRENSSSMSLCTYDEQSRTWHGPAVVSVYNPQANVGHILNRILLGTPERIIQIDMDTDYRMSCAEFRLRMVRFARGLTKAGLKTGDIVALASGNSENVAPLVCALMTIGAPFNPLAPGLNENDMAHMMRVTQPKMVFCDECNVDVVRKAIVKATGGELPLYVVESSRGDVLHAEDLLQETGGEEHFVPARLGDSHELLSMILCSSGTTGPPKGVCVTHAQIIAMLGAYPMGQPGTIFNFSPLYWATGMHTLLCSFTGASARLITRRPFSEETFFEAVEKHRINVTFMPPSYASQLVRHARVQQVDFGSLHMLALGGSYVSDGLRDQLDRLLPNGRTYNSLGSSELGWISTDFGRRKPGSVGTPAVNISAQIVAEDGTRLGVGERGQVLLKGPEPFVGYYRNEAATADTIDEHGFIRTGDVGYFDEEGYLYLIDRQKDIFKYRGFHVSPSELEAILAGIEGVLEVCVVGVPADADRTTELPTAAIVRAPGSTLTAPDVNRIFDGQVSDFSRLRGGVYFVEQLPKTPSGKILRRTVLDEMVRLRETEVTKV
uniref:AMP-dependent synthetase/ligase domain-containing protein n=1 Tax=Anopheles dirus TaxID=7168 RepID=A0A182NT79_9DIPT